MSIGIGGAGGKLATLLDENSTVVNVSQVEMDKVEAKNKILAVAHSSKGQFQGSGKNPMVGRTAFTSINDELYSLIQGELVFTATGGGTGNGITSVLLERLASLENVLLNDSTMFAFILPYLNRESSEYVENTISFLMQAVAPAIDSGNTGNIMFFTNKLKFEGRIPEAEFNQKIVDSLNAFFSIPDKNKEYKLLDGHIDYEDFKIFTAKPYFNHFMFFDYTPERPLSDLIRENYNQLLLPPEQPIEGMFLLEVPDESQTSYFYNILDYFHDDDLTPAYSVILNPNIEKPRVTLSLLYSRKPKELVDDFKQMADKMTRKKLKKSIEQFVKLERQDLDINQEVQNIENANESQNGVLDLLKRLRKLR